MTMTQIISRQNDNNWYRYSFLQAQPDPSRAMKKNKNLLPELETGSFIVWILIGNKNNEITDRIIPLKKRRSQGHMAKQKKTQKKSSKTPGIVPPMQKSKVHRKERKKHLVKKSKEEPAEEKKHHAQ